MSSYLCNTTLELRALNVIIGQNAAGKSNLLDVLHLLQSLTLPRGLTSYVSKTGGINEWIWKGKTAESFFEVEVAVLSMGNLYTYSLKVDDVSQTMRIYQETLARVAGDYSERTKGLFRGLNIEVVSDRSNVRPDESIFSPHFSDPGIRTKTGFTSVGTALASLMIYSDLDTSRKSPIRFPQLPDAQNDFLEEDGTNLALVLNDLELKGDVKSRILKSLQKFYPRIEDYSTRILGGTVQLFVREDNLEKPISAMRLSDGTLRYLCLLAILCHPEPPPLICIEEPEIGLHPDILSTIAELLVDATERTQLIVTTHSDILVSALSDTPESILVCEYEEENGTRFRRLEKDALKDWLDEYSLGELWLKGEIGGTRW